MELKTPLFFSIKPQTETIVGQVVRIEGFNLVGPDPEARADGSMCEWALKGTVNAMAQLQQQLLALHNPIEIQVRELLASK